MSFLKNKKKKEKCSWLPLCLLAYIFLVYIEIKLTGKKGKNEKRQSNPWSLNIIYLVGKIFKDARGSIAHKLPIVENINNGPTSI